MDLHPKCRAFPRPVGQFDAALEIFVGIFAERFQPITRVRVLAQIFEIGLSVSRIFSQIARALAVRES